MAPEKAEARYRPKAHDREQHPLSWCHELAISDKARAYRKPGSLRDT